MPLLLTLLACSNVSAPAFLGGGARYTTGESGTGGSGTGGGDTADTGSDTGTLPEGSALLADFSLSMNTGADSVTYVLGEISVTDTEGDVLGGTAYVDWYATSDSSTDGATLNIGSGSDATASEYAYLADDMLYLYVEGVNPLLEYLFVVQIRDQSGNLSNTVEGYVGPM